MNDCVQITSDRRAKERQDKRKLRLDTFRWQKAALGLFAMSMTLNMAQQAWIVCLEDSARANEALHQSEVTLYEKRIDWAQRELDIAIDNLELLTASVEADRLARAEQARAHEAVGEYSFLGTFQITSYCPCAECCGRLADGLTATGLPTGPGIVAVDPEVIPLGSTVVIDGQRYLAADTVVTGRAVDICLPSHQEAKVFGVLKADVWVVNS